MTLAASSPMYGRCNVPMESTERMLDSFASLIWRGMIAMLVAVGLSVAGGTFAHGDALGHDHDAHAQEVTFDAGHSHFDTGIDDADASAVLHCGAPIHLISSGVHDVPPQNRAAHVPTSFWASGSHVLVIEPPPPRI